METTAAKQLSGQKQCLCRLSLLVRHLPGNFSADLVSSALIFSGICTFLHVLGFKFGNTGYQWGTGEKELLSHFPHIDTPREGRTVQTALLVQSSTGESAH